MPGVHLVPLPCFPSKGHGPERGILVAQKFIHPCQSRELSPVAVCSPKNDGDLRYTGHPNSPHPSHPTCLYNCRTVVGAHWGSGRALPSELAQKSR